MNIVDGLQQGTPAWHQFRAEHFGASEAPAMLGVSKFTSRSELLRQKATGIIPEVDAATQRRFDDGHRAEGLCRPLAEKIVGGDLFPVVGREGKLSASFDGMTLAGDTIWEHKLLNDTLRAVTDAADLPVCYRAQMEQGLMLSGAERCLFSASRWDGETLVEERHTWYAPDMDLRSQILQGWTQFAIDLENYQHIEHADKPKGETIMDLPALSVQATGMVTYSNLPEFKAAAQEYIASINTELVTDQQFADAEATVKFCKSTEEKLEVTKGAILAQTATIDEVIRTVDHIQAQLRDKRLMLDKLVKSEKEARKAAMVRATTETFTAHVESLQSEITGIYINQLIQSPRFADAIKGLKSLASMQDALDTALANAKIEADSVAKDMREKLAWCKENAAGHGALFPDLQSLVVKPMEDFTLTITSRIEAAKKAEAEKLEAERKRMEAEATAKAEREAAIKIELERRKNEEAIAAQEARIRAEERAKAKADAEKQAIDAAEQRAHERALAGEPYVTQPATDQNVVVIEHQDEIGAFMRTRDFGKEAGKVRAILVEFVKFNAQRERKVA